MENKEIEEKKILLQQEIIDKHYDQQQFVEYCLTKKDNGDDIDSWSYKEMKEAVDEFVAMQKKEKEEKPKTEASLTTLIKSHTKDEEKDKVIENNISENIQDMNMSKPKEEDKSPSLIEIQCKKLEKSILNDKTIHVIIKNPKAAESSKFLSSIKTSFSSFKNNIPFSLLTITSETPCVMLCLKGFPCLPIPQKSAILQSPTLVNWAN